MTRRARTTALLVLVLAAAPAPAILRAQSWGVSVARHQLAQRTVSPGAVFTVTYKLTNRDRAAVTLAPRISAPPEWPIVTGTSGLTLRAGESSIWLVSVAVPAGAASGNHPLVLELVRPQGGRTLFSDTAVAVVLPRVAAAAALAAPPSFAISGERFVVPYTVRNTGNVAGRFRLEAEVTPGLTFQPLADVVELDAGEARTDTLRLSVARNLKHSASGRVELRVRPADGEGGVLARSDAEIALLPDAGALSQHHHLPLQVRLRAGQGDGIARMVAGVEGSGALWEDGGPVVDLFVRGPGSGFDYFGESDQYSGSLRARHFRVRVGDAYFDDSLLNGGMRLGTGAGLELFAGGWTLAGHSQRQRRHSDGAREDAVGLAYQFPAGGRLGVQHARLTGRDSADVTTVRWSGGILPGSMLELEYGTAGREAGRPDALAGNLRGSIGPFNYAASHQQGDRDYPGPMRAMQNSYGYASLELLKGFRLGGSASETRRDSLPGELTTLPGSDRSWSGFAELFHRLAVEYQRTERETRYSTLPRREGTEAVRLRVAQRAGPLAVSGGAEAGIWSDHLQDRSGPYRRYNLTSSLTLGRQSLSLHGDVREGRGPLGAGSAEREWSGGATVLLNLPGRLRTSVSGYDRPGFRLQGDGPRERVVDLRMDRSSPSGQTISLRLQAITDGGAFVVHGTRAALEYSLPLRVPLGPSRSAGRVVGRVMDAETRRPVRGAVVQVAGQLAISDPEGYVAFRGVSAGSHPVLLSSVGSAARRMSAGDSLVEVTGEAGPPGRFRLDLLRGGRIVGSLAYAQGPGSLAANRGTSSEAALSGVAVLLASGPDTLRLATDGHGAFASGEIRPGRWVVLAPRDGLPEPDGMEVDPAVVEVGPETAQQVSLLVRPRRRQVRIVAEGELVSSGSPAPRAPAAPRRAAPSASPGGDPVAEYVVAQGDRLTTIAAAVYGDPGLWLQLWRANRDRIPNPNHLLPNSRLRIPPLPASPRRQGLPPH